MKIIEIISELTFHGRQCTKDCSGHKAGLSWENKHKTNHRSQTPSNSFNNGTEIAVDFRSQGKVAKSQIRGDKGRFVKYQGKIDKRFK